MVRGRSSKATDNGLRTTDIRRRRTKNSVSTPRSNASSKPPACSKSSRRIAQQVGVGFQRLRDHWVLDSRHLTGNPALKPGCARRQQLRRTGHRNRWVLQQRRDQVGKHIFVAQHCVVVDEHQQRCARLRDALVAGAAVWAHAAHHRDLGRLEHLAAHARQQPLEIAVQRWDDQGDLWGYVHYGQITPRQAGWGMSAIWYTDFRAVDSLVHLFRSQSEKDEQENSKEPCCRRLKAVCAKC